MVLNLLSECPVQEDTLMRVIIIGLSNELPVTAPEALDLADRLVRRAAAVKTGQYITLTSIPVPLWWNIYGKYCKSKNSRSLEHSTFSSCDSVGIPINFSLAHLCFSIKMVMPPWPRAYIDWWFLHVQARQPWPCRGWSCWMPFWTFVRIITRRTSSCRPGGYPRRVGHTGPHGRCWDAFLPLVVTSSLSQQLLQKLTNSRQFSLIVFTFIKRQDAVNKQNKPRYLLIG